MHPGVAGAGAGAGVTAALGSSARLAATIPFARELVLNGAESVVSGGVDRGLTGGDIFNPRALATDLVTGGAASAPGGRLGPAEPEIPRYVFRGGSDTDINFTPRPVRDNSGLSTFENPEAAFGDKGKKAQIIQTDLLGDDLRAVPDAPPPGHVSIRPADMNTMPEWQATRRGLEGGGTPHPLTDQMRAAVVGEVRRGPDGTLIWPEGWNP